MKKGSFNALLVFQAISIVVFTLALWQADRALDKSGIGDPEKFNYWNQICGISFYAFLCAWVFGVSILAFIRLRLRQRKMEVPTWAQSNVGIWLPLALLSFGWTISIL